MSATTIPGRARENQGLRAGIVTRLGADTIDLAVVLAIIGALYLAASAVSYLLGSGRFRFPRPSLPLGLSGSAVLLIVYLGANWSSTGRTIGKRVLGLRVVDLLGRRLGLGIALLRALICVAFPVGLLLCTVSRRNASLADVLVRTAVIYDWRLKAPPREDRSATDVAPAGGEGSSSASPGTTSRPRP